MPEPSSPCEAALTRKSDAFQQLCLAPPQLGRFIDPPSSPPAIFLGPSFASLSGMTNFEEEIDLQ